MKVTSILTAVGAVACMCGVAVAQSAAAQSVKDFYLDKNITMIVPTGPGGTFALHGHLVARNMAKRIPGSPTITLQFMPGAGGAKAHNYLYNVAPRDGSFMGMPLPAIVLAQHLRPKAMKYDANKFNYLGRLADTTRLLILWHKAKAKTLDDLKKMQMTIASGGKNSNTALQPAVVNALIGTKLKVINGYRGAAPSFVALENGEVHSTTTNIVNLRSAKPEWLRNKLINIVLQIGANPAPGVKGVPMLQEFVKDPRDLAVIKYMTHTSDLGYGFMAPPAVHKARLAALSNAFSTTVKNKGFLAEAKKRGVIVNPASAAEHARIVRDAMATSDKIIARFIQLSGAKAKR